MNTSREMHLVKRNIFRNSIIEVATTLPAFIGYTEKALNETGSLKNTPFRITSLKEFQVYFGGAPTLSIDIQTDSVGDKINSIECNESHMLYYHLQFFFANGGESCYIVSVGDYEDNLDADHFINGIDALLEEREPTMLVIPEAVNLPAADCSKVQRAMLKHCGGEMKNRVAILDVHNGDKSCKDPIVGDVVEQFREGIGSDYLSYGAAYYPWVNTAVIKETEISLSNVKEDSRKKIQVFLMKHINDIVSASSMSSMKDSDKMIETRKTEYEELFAQITTTSEEGLSILHQELLNISVYHDLFTEALKELNCLPASAAIAGIYTATDNTFGVWHAPANKKIVNVTSAAVSLSCHNQEDIKIPMSDKSVNVLCSFGGEGVVVWGAHTLDGNSLNWRYINIRRAAIMLEESIKNVAKTYEFEPNNSNTWSDVKSTICHFLNATWKKGGIPGNTPGEAYKVSVGPIETHDSDKYSKDMMNISVWATLVRPGEFMEYTVQQQINKVES